MPVYPPDLLDRLNTVEPRAWTGTAFRHMFGTHPPERENTTGARWNPSGTAAIYVCLTHDGAVAEGDHMIAMQPVRPRAMRVVYELDVVLHNVLDLSDRGLLAGVGVGNDELTDDTMTSCREVGGAVAWLGHDGLLVPSARSAAINLVIYPTNMEPDAMFAVLGHTELPS